MGYILKEETTSWDGIVRQTRKRPQWGKTTKERIE